MWRQVRAALVPEERSIRAELHKLNVMTQGGFFKPHKDTPRGADTCFGTLVVTLPVPFTGVWVLQQHVAHSSARQYGWVGMLQVVA